MSTEETRLEKNIVLFLCWPTDLEKVLDFWTILPFGPNQVVEMLEMLNLKRKEMRLCILYVGF